MGHVFISYARADREYAVKLAQMLEDVGLSIWLDDRIAPGSHFDETIESALDSAEKVVVIWSASSVKSQWVRAEAGEGLRRGVLIPVAVDLSKIPLEFRRVQALDFSRWSGLADAPEFRSLERYLRESSPASAKHAGDPADEASVVRAELVSADRYHGNLRIRIHTGERSYRLDHEGLGRNQVLRLDGKIVAEGGGLFQLEDYFRCEKVAPGIELLELSVHGNAFRGIDHFAVRLNGRSVLTSALPLSRGMEVVIAVSVIFGIATIVGIELVLATFGKGTAAWWLIPAGSLLLLFAWHFRRRRR